MARTPLLRSIWQNALLLGPDLTTPEGRAALDKALKSNLQQIDDPAERANAAQILRADRSRLLGAADELRRARANLRHAETALDAMKDWMRS